ncbi:MAG: hypothetical protein AAF050_16860 [Cyanobacteria bacterium J06649_5]
MAYDSKTYGQSPFGKPIKSEAQTTKPAPKPLVDDGLDRGPDQLDNKAPSGLASKFPSIPTTRSTASSAGNSKAASSSSPSTATTTKSSKRKSGGKSGGRSTRKSKKAKEAEAAQAELEAAEAAVARRFFEEDRRAYLSLLQKTGISGLVWAVLRLSRYELPKDAIALVNIIIHPLVVSTLAFAYVIGLTFWCRRLLNDLARHTQALQTDAEAEDIKNSRPTLEIVGDSLEYNPKLRKNVARLFNAASILICTLTSYFVVIGLTLEWRVK